MSLNKLESETDGFPLLTGYTQHIKDAFVKLTDSAVQYVHSCSPYVVARSSHCMLRTVPQRSGAVAQAEANGHTPHRHSLTHLIRRLNMVNKVTGTPSSTRRVGTVHHDIAPSACIFIKCFFILLMHNGAVVATRAGSARALQNQDHHVQSLYK